MSGEDRYSVAEFARRYKIIQARLVALCEFFGLSADTILTRDEFRRMLDEFRARVPADEETTNEGDPSSEGDVSSEGDALSESDASSTEEERPQEENVSEGKKTFERWVKLKKIRHPVYLKITAGYDDGTLLTETEFDRAVDKYLLNKES